MARHPFGEVTASSFEHTKGNESNTESLEGSAPLSTRELQYNITGLDASYVYDLPFLAKRGLVSTLFGRWQLSGLATFQTGMPFSVVNGQTNDSAGLGNSAYLGT